jgi:hypothetical protein
LWRQNLNAANGNWAQAAKMYIGSPNQNIWGPQTNAYPGALEARMTSAGYSNPMQPKTGAQPVASLASLQQPPPVNTGANIAPQAPGLSLASLAGLPQGNIPTRNPTKFTAGNILGTLGDALMAYGHMQPQFAPFMRQEQILGQQQAFERQKFNAQLQMQLNAMLHPAEFMQAGLFNAMPPDQQRTFLQYQDATNPLRVATPQGTESVPRTQTKTVNGKNYYSIGDQWYEED